MKPKIRIEFTSQQVLDILLDHARTTFNLNNKYLTIKLHEDGSSVIESSGKPSGETHNNRFTFIGDEND